MSDKPNYNPDQRELCLCFHVPMNKIAKFIRLEDPRVVSQVSECYGAGTGCGWCIPFIEQLFEQIKNGEEPSIKMTADEYRKRRKEYHQKIGYDKEG